jgi:hypothetical protein
MSHPPFHASLQQALVLHQTGRLAEAATIYDKLLKKQPRDARLLFLLGSLRYQTAVQHF